MKKLAISIARHTWTMAIFVFLLFPLFWIVFSAFKPSSQVYSYPPVFFPDLTFEQFTRVLFNAPQIIVALRNSFLVALTVSFLAAIIGTAAAYSVSRFNYRGKGVLMSSSILFYVFPPIILVIPIFILFSSMRLFNSLLGLVIIYVATSLPFSMWFMKDYLDSIPKELDEQALVDGANYFQIFSKVILPLSIPGMGATVMFSWVIAWGEYLFAMVFITSQDKQTISLALTYYTTLSQAPWGEMAAAVTITSLPVIVAFLFLFNTYMGGLTLGAIKE